FLGSADLLLFAGLRFCHWKSRRPLRSDALPVLARRSTAVVAHRAIFEYLPRMDRMRGKLLAMLLAGAGALSGQGRMAGPRSAGGNASINKRGQFEDRFIGIEAAVKDEKRFPEKWAYFDFIGASGQALARAKPFPKEACWQCHNQHGAADNVFVQFYPVLRVATERPASAHHP